MPVLLAEKDFALCLSGKAGLELLKPAAEDTLHRWPVSKRVNSSRASDEDHTLIDRSRFFVTRPFANALRFPPPSRSTRRRFRSHRGRLPPALREGGMSRLSSPNLDFFLFAGHRCIFRCRRLLALLFGLGVFE
jgi:hypothetical protein